MRSSFLWKHIGITILSIGVVIGIVWLAIDYLAADYFMVLMKQYHISPTDSHQMFLDAVHRYRMGATVCALLARAQLLVRVGERKIQSDLIRVWTPPGALILEKISL